MGHAAECAEEDVQFLSRESLRAVGAELTIDEVHAAVGAAWHDIRSGASYGAKAVLTLSEEEFWQSASVAPFRIKFADERLGWKLSSLYSVNGRYGGVKVIGANAFNRYLGLPRSTSTVLLLEKRTLRPLVVMDGTAISAHRTGTYASSILDLFACDRADLSVFLFGTGPVAYSVIECLNFSHPRMVAEVFVRGRSDAALDKLISDFAGRTSFKLKPVLDNSSLSHCDVVITATNARTPLFEDDELDPGAITIHLGGNEAPEAYLQRALRTGLVVCDDIKTVSRRNSQSIALHFSKRTLSLEEIGPLIGIRELSAPIAFEIDPTAPVCVTCVGLPMLDLYVAQATYEKYLALKVKG